MAWSLGKWSWTPADVAEMSRLWLEGKSDYRICQLLNAPSRNAVVGKRQRIGLTRANGQAAAFVPPPPVVERRAPPAPIKLPAPPPKIVCEPVERGPVKPLLIPLLKLRERQCKWPYGDPRSPDFACCGLPQAPKPKNSKKLEPYCSQHAVIAHAPRGAN